jgi:outer membrane protein TolC
MVTLALLLGPIAGERAVAEPVRCLAESTSEPLNLSDAVIAALSHEPHLNLAREDVHESTADVRSSKTAFLPKGQLLVDDERFDPHGAAAPVTVVGNNILGGTRTYSAYGSVSISWNIMNSGRDLAAYHGALAGLRASDAALFSQLDDTLSGVLKAYAELHESHLSVEQKGVALDRLKAIAARSEERFRHGDGTTIAIGQAREAALDAEQTMNQACNSLTTKSLALAKALGVRLPANHVLLATSAVPNLPATLADLTDPQPVIEQDPEVVSAKEKVTQAESALKQTHAAFGPSISLDARRDYLGQNTDSLSAANNGIGPNSYRIGVSVVQPLFPFTSESSAITKARSELHKAQIAVEQARGDADARLRTAIAAQQEASASYRAALLSVEEASQVVALTRSLRKAGRTDLDNLEHAELDLEKSKLDAATLESNRNMADWDAARAFYATRFARVILHMLGIEMTNEVPN